MATYYTGQIALFPYARIPNNWLPCDGRTLAITAYQALFSLLGFTYGGDQQTVFRLPDLRGRTPVGFGIGNNHIYLLGDYGGQESVTLVDGNLPPHMHDMMADSTVSAAVAPDRNYFGQVVKSATVQTPQPLYAPASSGAAVPLNPASVSTVGAGAPHNNMQPFLALSYCIAAQRGLYPVHP